MSRSRTAAPPRPRVSSPGYPEPVLGTRYSTLGSREGGNGFISCDWGTSNLRLCWVEAGAESVVGEVAMPEGVRSAHQRWQAQGGDRWDAYLDILARGVAALEARLGVELDGAAVLVSGMASSSIGVVELPYAALPFPLTGEGVVHRVLERRLPGGQPVVLLSGVRAAADVMRGEETQLIGLGCRLELDEPAVVVLPGTHSKHARVEGRSLHGFATFLTGELFEAAVTHTVLGASVREEPADAAGEAAFATGVRTALREPLLHALFLARTNTLLGRLEAGANFRFLSGLLIGAELATLAARPGPAIHLCAGAALQPWYRLALEELGLGPRVHVAPTTLVEQSAALGQLAVWRRMGGEGSQIKDSQ